MTKVLARDKTRYPLGQAPVWPAPTLARATGRMKSVGSPLFVLTIPTGNLVCSYRNLQTSSEASGSLRENVI